MKRFIVYHYLTKVKPRIPFVNANATTRMHSIANRARKT